MNKAMKLVAAGLLASTMSVPAMAVEFVGSYTTAGHSSGDGLLIKTTPGPQNISFDIDQGESTGWLKLFNIWTDETDVNWGEDTSPKAFTLTFNFDSPDFDGVANGVTFGVNYIITQYGVLEWANGGHFDFAFGNGGLLSLDLTDADFNKGLFGLDEGKKHGDKVYGKFTLESVSAVPEPATWLTMIAGFGMVGAAMRRQKKVTAIAA
jgi:hypothetical protein